MFYIWPPKFPTFILPPRAPSELPWDLPTSSDGGKSFPRFPLLAHRAAGHPTRKLSNFHNGRMAPQVAGAKWWEPPHKCAPPSVGGAHTDGTTAHEHQRPLRPLFGTLARGAPVRPRSRSPSPGPLCFAYFAWLFPQSNRIHSRQAQLQRAIAQGTCTITTANFQGHALFQRYFPRKGRRDSRKVDPTFPASALSVLQSERPKP